MNKLLQSVTSAVSTLSNTNENKVSAMPGHVDLNIRVDMDTWRYFENLDDDSRHIMAQVLNDYVENQK
jgi:hypothetical protein